MSNFAFLAAEFPAANEAAERQAAIHLSYGNISGTI